MPLTTNSPLNHCTSREDKGFELIAPDLLEHEGDLSKEEEKISEQITERIPGEDGRKTRGGPLSAGKIWSITPES